MKKIKLAKRIAFLTGSLTITVGMSASITYASFAIRADCTQTASYKGELPVSIYLNANIWDTADAIFYLYAFDAISPAVPTNQKWIASSKTITPTIRVSGDDVNFKMYVFRLDVLLYPYFLFGRFNPNGANVPSFTDNDNPKSLWNQTIDITYSSSINYYCINAWDDGYGKSTVQADHLTSNNGTLTFS